MATKTLSSSFYGCPQRMEVIMAVLIGLGACLIRLATGPSNIFLGLAALLGLYLWWKNGKRFDLSPASRKYMKVCLIFFLLTLVSMVDVDNKKHIFSSFFNTWIIRFAFFFLIVAFVKRKEYLLRMLSAFLVIFSWDCFTACYQFFVLHKARGNGFHGDYLDLTAIICMILPLSAILLMDSHIDKTTKRFALLGLASAIAGLFGCFGRGAFLVSALTAPFYLFYYVRNSKKILSLALVLLCLVGGTLFFSPKYSQRLSTTLNTTSNTSNVDRIWTWKSSIDMYLDHPVNGVGLDNWELYYKDKGYKYPQESQNLPHAHSNYMQLLAETGTIGMLGFIYFYLYSLFTPFKRWLASRSPYDLICFTAFLASMVFFGAFQPTYRLSSVIRTLWFVLAVMLQLKQCDEPLFIRTTERG